MSSPPTTLGQYQIIREIARSNDIVYEAYDPLMNRRVAIKELAVPQGSTPQQREERISRFKREAQAAGTLNHPNIMTVFSFAEDGSRTFMAMEYLDGATLRNEIDTRGFIPIDRAVEIAIQILDGLSHAHAKGVIHRDIKPDNIQILSTSNIKITDFGIARLTFQPNLTMDGQVFGTPSYMSPEQVVGKDIDARSDLFSVGVLLYEMVCGQKPFAGDSVVSITYAIMNKEPVQPQQCGYGLWQIIRKALEKSPMMRFGSAAEMGEALKDTTRGEPSQSPVPNQSQSYSGVQSQTGYSSTSQSPYQPQGYAPSQQSAPQVYPYNPYNPYATPPVQPQGGYSTAPYNPQQAAYAQQPYSQSPYNPGASMPPPGPLPVYYPPPPRQALLKPETVDFLKKLSIAFVLLGTLLVLMIVIVHAASELGADTRATQHDQAVVAATGSPDPRTPLLEQIQKAKEEVAQMRSSTYKTTANQNLAVLYERYGKQLLDDRHPEEAESYFQSAVEADPTNPALQSDLAALYGGMAQQQTDPQASADLWKQSAVSWQRAWTAEQDPSKKNQYGVGAASASYYYAWQELRVDPSANKTVARQALETALQTAPPNGDLYAQIQQLLTQVR